MILPPKVQIKNGRYYYREQSGGAAKYHKLSRVVEGPTAFYAALQQFTGDRPSTYGQLMILYMAQHPSDPLRNGGLFRLKPASRPEYMRIINAQLQPRFGHMMLNTLEPVSVAQYVELRRKEGAPIGGNRERAVLGSVCSWGMSQGYVKANPTLGVKRNTEKKSKVYVEDAQLKAAIDVADEPMQNILAVAFLTGLRQTDLRNLLKSAVTPEGLIVDQSKDGKRRTVSWTPRLRHFIDRALSVPPHPQAELQRVLFERLAELPVPEGQSKYAARGQAIRALCLEFGLARNTVYYWLANPGRQSRAQERRAASPYLFVGASGKPFTEDGIQSAMKRLKAECGGQLFKFRELRPKAATDAKHNVLGHSAQMLPTYLRRTTVAPVR